MAPIVDPSKPKPWPDGSWNVSVVPLNDKGNVGTEFSPGTGFPYLVQGFQFPNENGSLAITFQRPQGSVLNETRAYVYTDFDYPYSGSPERLIANFELLVNGTYAETISPTEQWYVIKIRANPPVRGQPRTPTTGNLTIDTTSSSGLSITASTDINEYFQNSAWGSLGYQNWQDWLNGTENLPSHFDQMKWVTSEGSQANQTWTLWNSTELPYNIVQVKNWTVPTLHLTNSSMAGETRIYVDNITEGFRNFDAYFSIGSNATEEAGQVRATGQNYIDLENPLKYDHDANETVMLTDQTIGLFENLSIDPNQVLYVLVKVQVSNIYDVFTLNILGKEKGGIEGYQVLDENLKGLSQWRIVGRTVLLHVPIKVRVFIGPANQDMANLVTLFPLGVNVPAGFAIDPVTLTPVIKRPLSGSVDDGWIISRTSVTSAYPIIDDERAIDLLRMFPASGKYRFGMEITFLDTSFSDQNVSTTVYIDDLTPRMYGTSFGLLGSDQYGRDLFAQLIYGTRISLYLGILVAIVSVSIGLFVGLLAGYVGGAADQFLMRFNDLMLVLPSLPLMIVLVAVLGARIENLIVLLGFLGWNGFARLVRSQVLSLKERPFIESAKASGAGTGHILVRHILPHVMALVYISLATAVPGAVTTEAALSFLGFYDPNRMSWGRMLNEVFTAGATRNWWWIIPPGLCIALLAMAFILLGFALDDILNPKLRQRK